MAHTVRSLKWYLNFRQALYLDHCYLTFLCYLIRFFHEKGIAYYTDNNTPHSTNKNLKILLHELEELDTLFKIC